MIIPRLTLALAPIVTLTLALTLTLVATLSLLFVLLLLLPCLGMNRYSAMFAQELGSCGQKAILAPILVSAAG